MEVRSINLQTSGSLERDSLDVQAMRLVDTRPCPVSNTGWAAGGTRPVQARR